jgi:hypothetical protein
MWIAEGTWLPAGTKPPQKGKKYETPKIEDKDAPPRLQRGGPKPPESKPAESKPAETASAEKPALAPAPKSQDTAKAAEPETSIEDPNRPILRRGKPDPAVRRELVKNFDEEEASTSKEKKAVKGEANSPQVTVIPAISDAAGPDPRPFNFELRAGEEAGYRTKMLALASAELAKANAAPPEIAQPHARKTASVHKTAAAMFDDVKLRIFDLSNSNDPVLILSAKARPSSNAGSTSPVDGEEITLVARTNLDGDLRRLFFAHTDALHLDVSPRMELVDAVDADGDGRGELLFRRTSDAGSSYAIYRATADRLWPLYEGTP